MFLEMMMRTNSIPAEFRIEELFEYSRQFFGVFVNAAKSLKAIPKNFEK